MSRWWCVALVVVSACRPDDPQARERHRVAEGFASEARTLMSVEPARAVIAARLAADADPLDPSLVTLGIRARAWEAFTLGLALPRERWVATEFEASWGVKSDPEAAHVYAATLALMHWVRGDLTTGLDDLRVVVKEHPDWALAHVTLGRMLDASQKPAEALAELDTALTLDPSGRGPYLEAGRLHLKHGTLPRAVQLLEEAVSRQDSFEVRVLLAEAYDRSARRVDAAAQLQRAVGLEPKNAATRLNYADHLVEQGQFAEAQSEYVVAGRNGGEPLATRGLALIAFAQKDWPSALKSLDLVLKAAPNDPSSLFFAGEAAEQLKKPTEALGYYERFVQAAATNPAEADRLALVQERVARLKK